LIIFISLDKDLTFNLIFLDLFFPKKVINFSGEFIFILFTSIIISHFRIHDFSAIDHCMGFTINHSPLINILFKIACLYVGSIFDSSSVDIIEFIQIGFIHIKNNIEKIILASKKFINTHPSNIIDFCR